MGHVYAAIDDVLGRSVAVKTLHGRTSELGKRILDERFRLEARAIAALTHPGIVQVYDIDLTADPPYLVMERVTGPSLRERFESAPMSANDLRACGIQIARALAAAHAAGIVHRDVKPANILIAGPRTWKLADFGVAHVPDSSLTITGQFVGSPAYAPPEALIRGQSTAAGDVFGLGATLYFCAAGRWPRADATSGGLLAPVPSLRELAPNLPEDLITTIDRAVALEPEQRPTAAELAELLAGAPATSPTETVFVPDDTHDGSRAAAPGPSPAPLQTAFVRDATEARSRPHARASPRARWRSWAIAAGALAILIAIAVSTSSTSSGVGAMSPLAAPATAAGTANNPASADPAPPAVDDPPPGHIRVVAPHITDHRAAKDWNKLVDKLYDHKFDEARRKLDDWERKWGETDETRSLRRQLEAMPAEMSDD